MAQNSDNCAPLQPSHRRHASSLLPDDPVQPHAVQPTASVFSSKILQFRPLIASKSSPTQLSTSYSIPRHPHNIQAKSQAPADGHHREIIFCVNRREELVVEKWTKGSLTLSLPPLTPPLGPFDDEDTGLPHFPIAYITSGAREYRFSTFYDERVHLLPVHLVDQTLPLPADDRTTGPCHPPALSHWILTTSPTATLPGTQ